MKFLKSNKFISSVGSPPLVAFSPSDKSNCSETQYFFDTRFNVRYMGSFFYQNNKLTLNYDRILRRISNNLPYWSFIESFIESFCDEADVYGVP